MKTSMIILAYGLGTFWIWFTIFLAASLIAGGIIELYLQSKKETREKIKKLFFQIKTRIKALFIIEEEESIEKE